MPDLSARGAANPQTIRAHIDLVEDLARQMHDGRWLWDDDADGFFAELHRRAQEIEQHAVAALDLLGQCEADMFDHPVGKVRLVPDYQPGIDPEHCAPGWVESDPAPRGDADGNQPWPEWDCAKGWTTSSPCECDRCVREREDA